MSLSVLLKFILVNTGISPFLLNSFIIDTISTGMSVTPIHIPFTNNFVEPDKYSGEHSITVFILVFALNHFIIG